MMASVISILLIVLSYRYIQGSMADTKIIVTNRCPYTVWAASNNPNDGHEIESGQSWNLTLPADLEQTGRIWGRTGCKFDKSGVGSCTTGDCEGKLQCEVKGAAPATFIGYQVYGYSYTDYYYVSLVDGFNVPLSIVPLAPNTMPECISVSCKKDINAVCKSELKVPQGCKSGCAAFPTNDHYCCTGDYANQCTPTNYSRFFKAQCPDAYSYAEDTEEPATYCPSGTAYQVLFCP